jgi:L-malate glycosyltransferase
LNILFVISSLKHGGAEKQTVIDANLFSDVHNVIVVTFVNGELAELLDKKVKLIVIEKKSYPGTAKKIRKIILEEKINVINSSLFASMVISYLAARKTGTPVIWYFHSHEYDIGFKSKLTFRLIAKSKTVRKIYFVNSELRNSFSENGYNFPEYKTCILYNTYTVNSKKRDFSERVNGKIKIGYIGRLAGLKRTDYLIELAAYLKKNNIDNFEIDIIGDGEKKKEIIEYAVKLKVNDYVNIPGFKTDIENYYPKFDMFILPSSEECLSISLIDACVSSLPCIAFNVGGNDEIIINNKTGFLVNNKEEMFEKARTLIESGELRKEFGSEANKYCADKFSIKKRKELLENIFTSINYKI